MVLAALIIIIISISGYLLAFYFKNKQKWSIAVMLLIAIGLILRMYVSKDIGLRHWDERYHALVAKNLGNHFFKPTLYDNPVLPFDYKNWTANHIWLHKQPLPLWLMAISIKIFGNNEYAVRLISIILSTIGIYLTFLVGTLIYNRHIGFFACFLFSLNGLIIEITGGRVATDHIDVAFMFFTLLSVTLIAKFNHSKIKIFHLLIGATIGLALLCKWLPALFIIPVWFTLYYKNEKIPFELKNFIFCFGLLILGIIFTFLPWQIYTYITYPNEMKWETFYNVIHFTKDVEEHSGSIFYFLDRIRINYGEYIYLPLAWFLYITFKSKDTKNIAILLWFLIPLVFFSIAKTKMQAYILFTAPYPSDQVHIA